MSDAELIAEAFRLISDAEDVCPMDELEQLRVIVAELAERLAGRTGLFHNPHSEK
jgi:hypothetical protein